MTRRWLHDPDAQDTIVDALCWVLVAAIVWWHPLFWPVWLGARIVRMVFGG